ncbi:hypothetical protein SELMODRAFT_438996 [Selaginella moellendorffii]|uniref:Uncharacterized protein n=1 Tax=Selaginella moellendorffii TaxID=88036 RepID=D8R1L5_SELML|nr:hypothetical protein SELMODRAFT_438996 [Selaginella moellendorffii]
MGEQGEAREGSMLGEEENQELYSPSDLIIRTAPNAKSFSRWALGNRKFLCDFMGRAGARARGGRPIQLVSFGICPLGPNAIWRNSPILTGVGYGGLVLNGPGLASYTLCFPAPQVFKTLVPLEGGAVGVPPAGALVNYELDLYYIQQAFSCLFEPMY